MEVLPLKKAKKLEREQGALEASAFYALTGGDQRSQAVADGVSTAGMGVITGSEVEGHRGLHSASGLLHTQVSEHEAD